MIRIETSRQTVVTFKTEKGALNRVARDTEWFASAAEPGTEGVVEVTARYDADAARTLFDVDYVVYREVAPAEVPEGAQGHVSGSRRSHLGHAVPYGYSARVVALHESGRLRLLNHTGTLVQREDEVLTLLPGSLDVPGTRDEDALTAEDIAEGAWLSGVGPDPLAPATDAQLGAQLAASDQHYEWFHVVLGGSAGDSTVQVQGWIQALDLVRAVLEPDLDGTVDVKVLRDSDGSVAYDVAEHDTCGVHPDATFSKDGPCPVCVEEDERWESDPAGAEAAGDSKQAAVLRALLYRDDHGTRSADGITTPVRGFLSTAERAALDHAIYVLEG